MATDLTLVVLDRERGAVVCERWLGGNQTLDAARRILARSPTAPRTGLECWAPVEPGEVQSVAHARYADGLTPDEVQRLAARFPPSRFTWLLVRDF